MTKQEYVLFDEPYPIKKKVPCFVSMDRHDDHFPPDNVINCGAENIRRYWNWKNLRKRKEVK